MDAAGSRGGETHPEPPVPFCVAAGGKSSGFLMAHLDEADFALAQRLDDAVDAVAGDPEDGVDAPVGEHLAASSARAATEIGSQPLTRRQGAPLHEAAPSRVGGHEKRMLFHLGKEVRALIFVRDRLGKLQIVISAS